MHIRPQSYCRGTVASLIHRETYNKVRMTEPGQEKQMAYRPIEKIGDKSSFERIFSKKVCGTCVGKILKNEIRTEKES